MIKKPKKFFTKKKSESLGKEIAQPVVKKSKKQPKEQGVVIKRKTEPVSKLESPKINRIIPDPISLKQRLASLHISKASWIIIGGAIVVIFLLAFFATRLFMGLQQLEQLQAQRASLLKQRATWTQIVEKYPGYRDAYFQLAVISYQLKDFRNAEQYVEKVLQLDPLFTPAQQLQSEIRIAQNKAL